MNQNIIDVEKSIVNHAMCSFKVLKLKNGCQYWEILVSNGYFMRCFDAENVAYIEIILEKVN